MNDVNEAGDQRRAEARTPTSSRAFDAYRDTALWSAIDATIAELSATRELSVNTAPDYVVGYICQELAAKRLTVSEALHK